MSASSLGPWGLVSPSDLPRSPGRSYQAQLAAPVPGHQSVLPGISLADLREVPAELRHHASCCCLCRRGGLAPRTIIVATPDQVLCVSVCQSIWIFTSRAGDSFNFKSPANNVSSSECFHHWASTYTATCTGFVRARVVSQQSLPILCRNCSRRIVSLPVLILA